MVENHEIIIKTMKVNKLKLEKIWNKQIRTIK
jgi:hypothetical protein